MPNLTPPTAAPSAPLAARMRALRDRLETERASRAAAAEWRRAPDARNWARLNDAARANFRALERCWSVGLAFEGQHPKHTDGLASRADRAAPALVW